MHDINRKSPATSVGTTLFDHVAGEYDATFTDTPLGKRQRGIVHRYLSGAIRPGLRVLELNCGTGADALWLAEQGCSVLATDAAEGMVEIASRRGRGSGVADRLSYRRMAIEELRDRELARELGPFDLVFSDFDGLNCVSDITWLPEALDAWLAPRGEVILVFMSPICLMEIGMGLARGRMARALQRLQRRGVDAHIGNGVTVKTYFHAVWRTRRAFTRRGYTLRTVQAIGLITPPTLVRTLYHRQESWFRKLFGLEDALAPRFPFNRVGDHVLMHFRRSESR